MGLIRKTILGSALAGGSVFAYLGASTTLISPLPRDDPIWTSKSYKKLNIHENPTTQDIVIKRVPLAKIKPELLQAPGALVKEFSRGVWSGLGGLCSFPPSPQFLTLLTSFHSRLRLAAWGGCCCDPVRRSKLTVAAACRISLPAQLSLPQVPG
jgi:hypothetical protein